MDKMSYFHIIKNKLNEVNTNLVHLINQTARKELINKTSIIYKLLDNLKPTVNNYSLNITNRNTNISNASVSTTTTANLEFRNKTSIIYKIFDHLKLNESHYSPTTTNMTTNISDGSVFTTTSSIKIVIAMAPSILTSSSSIPPSSNSNRRENYFLCPQFIGGFGNQLFQFASVFGIAKSKNMRVIIGSQSELNGAFKLGSHSNVLSKPTVDIRPDVSVCQTFQIRQERQACAYDPNLVNFNATDNFRLTQYLQSWKYFDSFKKDLKMQLTFRDHIQAEAYQIIKSIVKKFNYTTRREVTLIGVHVRRGDMVGNAVGYDVAAPEYMNTSVDYFLSRYNNPIFVISSQDIPWTTNYIPKNILVEYINHPKRDVIVAILASCDHTITTVGSFGWWIGWLAGGEVTYYKWPAKEGSGLRNQYSQDYSDYFYPGWIGL